MFPSKYNMTMDYKSEINRLFSAPENVDVLTNHPYGVPHSPFHYLETNQSSSSADSISPESFADITTFRANFSPVTPQNQQRHEMALLNMNRPVKYETPKEQFVGRRLRPIVGRQIFSSTDAQSTPKERVPVQRLPETCDVHMSSPEEYFQQTPPNPTFVERNCNRNLYELFPVENREFKYRTPVKTSPSPTMSVSTGSPIKLSPTSMPKSPVSPMMYRQPVWPGRSRQNMVTGQKLCSLCRKNGETPVVYMSHTVKERVGDQLIVSCPILRAHVCSTCGATGDNAHTMTYCPVLRSSNNGQPLRSTTITLKSTRVKSNGRRRF